VISEPAQAGITISLFSQGRFRSKCQRQTSVTGQARRGLDPVGKYTIVIFRVGQIGDATNETQILRDVVPARKVEQTVGRNMRSCHLVRYSITLRRAP
jgi:hypothetical protein